MGENANLNLTVNMDDSRAIAGFKKLHTAMGTTNEQSNRMRVSTSGLRRDLGALRNQLLIVAFTYGLIIRPMMQFIDAANKMESATIGLGAVAQKVGTTNLKAMVVVSELTASGLLSITDASAGLKNLLSTGIGLDKATELMKAFTDAAAFNRQGTLQLGEAVVGASQGYKNFLSQLIDNVGVTRNLSNMQKDYAATIGKTIGQLSDAEKYLAGYYGIMKDATIFTGNAAIAAELFQGKQARLNKTIFEFNAMVGKVLQPLIGAFMERISSLVDKLREWYEINELLINVQFKEFINKTMSVVDFFGNTIGTVVENVIKLVWNLRELIKVLALYKAAIFMATKASLLFAKVGNTRLLGGIGGGILQLSSTFGVAAYNAEQFNRLMPITNKLVFTAGNTAGITSGIFARLGATIAKFSGYIGIAALAIYGIIKLIDYLRNKSKRLREEQIKTANELIEITNTSKDYYTKMRGEMVETGKSVYDLDLKIQELNKTILNTDLSKLITQFGQARDKFREWAYEMEQRDLGKQIKKLLGASDFNDFVIKGTEAFTMLFAKIDQGQKLFDKLIGEDTNLMLLKQTGQWEELAKILEEKVSTKLDDLIYQYSVLGNRSDDILKEIGNYQALSVALKEFTQIQTDIGNKLKENANSEQKIFDDNMSRLNTIQKELEDIQKIYGSMAKISFGIGLEGELKKQEMAVSKALEMLRERTRTGKEMDVTTFRIEYEFDPGPIEDALKALENLQKMNEQLSTSIRGTAEEERDSKLRALELERRDMEENYNAVLAIYGEGTENFKKAEALKTEYLMWENKKRQNIWDEYYEKIKSDADKSARDWAAIQKMLTKMEMDGLKIKEELNRDFETRVIGINKEEYDRRKEQAINYNESIIEDERATAEQRERANELLNQQLADIDKLYQQERLESWLSFFEKLIGGYENLGRTIYESTQGVAKQEKEKFDELKALYKKGEITQQQFEQSSIQLTKAAAAEKTKIWNKFAADILNTILKTIGEELIARGTANILMGNVIKGAAMIAGGAAMVTSAGYTTAKFEAAGGGLGAYEQPSGITEGAGGRTLGSVVSAREMSITIAPVTNIIVEDGVLVIGNKATVDELQGTLDELIVRRVQEGLDSGELRV